MPVWELSAGKLAVPLERMLSHVGFQPRFVMPPRIYSFVEYRGNKHGHGITIQDDRQKRESGRI